jgi:hypothetical protein
LEGFKALLEMHSENVLPNQKEAQMCLYGHLWLIGGNLEGRHDGATGLSYYPFTLDDLRKALVTLNVYIGRYRKQGRFALQGEILNWGKWLASGH